MAAGSITPSGTTPSPASELVLKTGASTCWDTEGRVLKCEDTGQDGELQRGWPWPADRFDDQNNGTVADRLTDLIWLKNANAFGEVTWEEALSNAKRFADGSHGLTDKSAAGEWRLPNLRELLSLIDYGQADPILPKNHPFENVDPAIYWTSTTLAPAAKLAWMITLGIGPTVFVVKTSVARMWPVKGSSKRVLQTGQQQAWNGNGEPRPTSESGQDGELRAGVDLPSAADRFDDRKNGTVLDKLSGLVWLHNADAFGFKTWSHALECCRSLRHGDLGLADGSKRGDWRLPNIREIESLVDYGQVGPCLPKDHPFKNVRPSSYWTSTTVAGGPTQAMFIILGVGPSIFEDKEHAFFVWPVRDRLPQETNGR